MAGWLEPDDLKGPFQTKPFYYVIGWDYVDKAICDNINKKLAFLGPQLRSEKGSLPVLKEKQYPMKWSNLSLGQKNEQWESMKVKNVKEKKRWR